MNLYPHDPTPGDAERAPEPVVFKLAVTGYWRATWDPHAAIGRHSTQEGALADLALQIWKCGRQFPPAPFPDDLRAALYTAAEGEFKDLELRLVNERNRLAVWKACEADHEFTEESP